MAFGVYADVRFVPLSLQALGVLQELEPLTGTGKYVNIDPEDPRIRYNPSN